MLVADTVRCGKYGKKVDILNGFYYINPSTVRKILSKIWAAWKRFAHVIGRFQTAVAVTLFYFLILSPAGLLGRLVGWDPLDSRASKRRRSTNWKPVVPEEPDLESLRRQS